MTVTLHEDQYAFCIMSRSVILIMRKVSGTSCRENQNTLIMFKFFFSRKSRLYEMKWKNIVDPDRS